MYKMNTPPNVLDNMFWYDIQFLYKRFIKQIEDEQKAQEDENASQQEEMDRYRNDYRNEMPKMPDYQSSVDSITRGFNSGNFGNFNL